MSRAERAAIEGVLTQLRPAVAVEIGSAEGASLRRIAAHSTHVHSFDLAPPSLPVADNVTLHTGDSHELLPRLLDELAEQGQNVDFALVDGDHSPEGVRRDLEDLLDSRSLARTVILIHDTSNERVRQGVDSVRFASWPKVTHVDLDWLPGQLFAEPALRNELWYGLGLVLVDAARPAYLTGSVYEQRYHPAGSLLAEMRERVLVRERYPAAAGDEPEDVRLRKRVLALTNELSLSHMRERELAQEIVDAREQVKEAEQLRARADEADHLRARVEAAEALQARAERTLEDVMTSPSWKVTEPLRTAKRLATRRKD